jgi:hypothetical protein
MFPEVDVLNWEYYVMQGNVYVLIYFWKIKVFWDMTMCRLVVHFIWISWRSSHQSPKLLTIYQSTGVKYRKNLVLIKTEMLFVLEIYSGLNV